MKYLKSAFVVVAVLALNSACFAQEGSKVSEKTKTETYDILDKDLTTIKFDKGSTMLSDTERSTLRAMIIAALNDSEIKNVVVAAWSDSSYPAKNGVKLNDSERKLADQRGKNVKAVFIELGVPNTKVYSMAEHPSWITKAFHTEEAETKLSVNGKHVEDQKAEAIAQILETKGGPSTVVVIVQGTISKSTSH